jgi:hypothetical protein
MNDEHHQLTTGVGRKREAGRDTGTSMQRCGLKPSSTVLVRKSEIPYIILRRKKKKKFVTKKN